MANKTTDNRRRGRIPVLENQDLSQEQVDPSSLRARPANENDPATAMMLARLRRAPSYTVFVGVFFLSLIWVFTWSYVYSDLLLAGQAAAKRTPAEQLQALIMLIVPIASMLAIAYFQWRAQQLKQVSEVLMHQAMRLIRPQDIASDGLTSIAQAVRQEVDLLVGGVEHAFQRATALEEIVHKEISAVERAFGANEERIRGIVSGLEGQRMALQQTSALVDQDAQPMLLRLESNTQNLNQVIDLALSTFGRLEDGLKGSTSELARTIENVALSAATTGQEIGGHSMELQRLSSGLISDFQSFSSQLNDHVQTLHYAADSLGTETKKFGGDIKDLETNLLLGLRQGVDQITNANVEAGQIIERSSSQLSTRLVGTSTEVVRNLETTLTQANQIMAQSGAELASRLMATSTEIVGTLESSIAHANQIIGQSGAEVASRLMATSTEVVGNLETSIAQANQIIGQSGDQLSSRLIATSTEVVGNLESSVAQANQIIGQSGAEVVTRIMATSTEVVASLESTIAQANQIIGQSGTEVANRLVGTSSDVIRSLEASMGQATRQMSTVGTSVNDLLVGTSGTIAAHLKDTSEIVSRQMQDSGLALAQNMESSGGMVTDRLISISGEFVQRLSATNSAMITSITASTNELETRFESISGEITNRVDALAGDTVGHLETVAARVNSQLGKTALNLTEQVASVTNDLTSKLDKSSIQLGSLLGSTEQRLGNQLEQASAELTALFDVNTSSMVERLNTTSADLGQRFDAATEHLESLTGEISKRLDTQGQRFAETLNSASGQIFTDLGKARDAFSEGLGETAMQITGRFEQETGLIVGRIDNAMSAFDAAASSSGTKLDSASEKFAKHVETANTYLADQLAAAAGEIDSKLETVSMQLTGRLEMTGSRISDRLEDVSSLVDKSITKFNSEMENMLTSRRDAMDKLVEDANRRAVEVDTGMASYMALIEESLNTAETRAQNISRIVTDQTSQALDRLEDELRKLEANSTGQVSQAARALREQHERALASMNEMLSSTASDFQQTAQDMRITAQQVVKDIDSARNELKRAVIDLPEETRLNADNMRKVVADQINALNALSEVVRNQAGSLNYSTPGYATPRTPYGSGGSGPGKSEGASFLSPVSGSMSARSTAADRPATESKAKAEPATVVNLAREVDGYSAKLNAAARDVVEALDGSLPRDLEKRYASSDKSVYAHRLYEGRSRKMTKSIESRYAEERLLRSRIQAYNRLFEKLLDTLSDAKGGDDVMEQVLASEQGRIYVMLAEAAGRLPSQS
ncbi:MAG: hypothetical protein ABIN69_10145 [Aestuariivirga sp.]